MRTGTLVLLALGTGLAAGVGLTATGHLPWAAKQISALASSLPAPSALFPSGPSGPRADAGPADAAVDARPAKVQTAPLSSAQLSAPLYGVTFLAACGAPADMRVTLKASVQMGRATDVRATTAPPDPAIESCIEHAVGELQWDRSKKVGKVTVRY